MARRSEPRSGSRLAAVGAMMAMRDILRVVELRFMAVLAFHFACHIAGPAVGEPGLAGKMRMTIVGDYCSL